MLTDKNHWARGFSNKQVLLEWPGKFYGQLKIGIKKHELVHILRSTIFLKEVAFIWKELLYIYFIFLYI